MTKMISSSEAAKRMGVSSRYIIRLCKEGRINGAVKEGRIWQIPIDSILESNVRNADEKRLPCGVGKSSYIELSQECYYVDKTLLIKELLDENNEVTLFTRPRRFGKTSAMSMLQTFFEKTGEDCSRYFKDKKIWDAGAVYLNHMGRYPVIALTFKDVKYSEWGNTRQAISQTVKDEYKRHKELFGKNDLDAEDRRYLDRLMDDALTDVELASSLYRLTQMLYTIHGEKVVILIDEYDTPIQQGYNSSFYDNIIEFMCNFFSGGLKDNRYLAFGVLTGILRISKENLFSGLNNPKVNTIVDDAFSEHFGFTHDEVMEMARYYHAEDKMDEIRLWYDGYLFGKTKIYNPWSVMNYFNNKCKPKTFWVNTGENEVIRRALERISPAQAKELVGLLQGGETTISLNMEIIYPSIEQDIGGLYSFLLVAGYLQLTREAEETTYGTYASVAIPNIEIRRVYENEVLNWISDQSGQDDIVGIRKALYVGDAKALEEGIRNFILKSVSFYDASTEGFYHGLMLGLVSVMSDQYKVVSNREAGLGRFDIAMIPADKSSVGIIMEFKNTNDKKDDIHKLACDALKQIEDNKYTSEFIADGIKKVKRYGVAFCGKQVAVEEG